MCSFCIALVASADEEVARCKSLATFVEISIRVDVSQRELFSSLDIAHGNKVLTMPRANWRGELGVGLARVVDS